MQKLLTPPAADGLAPPIPAAAPKPATEPPAAAPKSATEPPAAVDAPPSGPGPIIIVQVCKWSKVLRRGILKLPFA